MKIWGSNPPPPESGKPPLNFTPPPPLKPIPRRRKGDLPPIPAEVMREAEEKVSIAMRYALVFMLIGGIVGFAIRGLLCQ